MKKMKIDEPSHHGHERTMALLELIHNLYKIGTSAHQLSRLAAVGYALSREQMSSFPFILNKQDTGFGMGHKILGVASKFTDIDVKPTLLIG